VRFYVYVFELRQSRCVRSCRSKDRCREKSKSSTCLYVGSSYLTPRERVNRPASRYAKGEIKRLRPDLSYGLGPYNTRREAESAEKRLAWKLRREGFTVFQA
jgi:hypothetical protein